MLQDLFATERQGHYSHHNMKLSSYFHRKDSRFFLTIHDGRKKILPRELVLGESSLDG